VAAITARLQLRCPAAAQRQLRREAEIAWSARQREDVLAAFERKMSGEAEVQQCYFVSGETDYLLVVTCRDMEAYNEFARRVLANEHNIKRFRTSFNLSRIKYETKISLGE